MDAGLAILDKSQRRMKCIRGRIWWLGVDFAHDALVTRCNACLNRSGKAGARSRACGRSDHKAVHLSEARITRAEPEEMRVIIAGALVEGQQEGVEASYFFAREMPVRPDAAAAPAQARAIPAHARC
jgi:hypothetical protein